MHMVLAGCLIVGVLACAPGGLRADSPAELRYVQTRDGDVTYHASGGVGPATPFALASLGKTMTAVAVLRLVAQGQLSLDDAPQAHLPADLVADLDLPDGLTLRHLLNMTSGLPDYLDDAFVTDALDDPARVQTPRAALRYAVDEKRVFAPGERFDYSNTNYVLLGLILEQASRLSFAQVMQDQVFVPAGMTNAFVFGSQDLPPDFPDAFEEGQSVRAYYSAEGMGDGGVIGSAADLARFYRALFGGGLLAPAQMADLLSDPLGESYGMGLELEGDLVGHSGGDLGFSADIRLDRDSGSLAVFLAAQADADTGWTYEALGY